jgi:hypothetical protein
MIWIDPQLAEIARDDIPERYAHVVGLSIAPSGRYAVVMLMTNEGEAIELDQTVAEHVDDRWVGLSSGTPSTVVYAGDHRAAMLFNSEPQPTDVRQVVVRDRGEDHDVPVENGYFLYGAWKIDVPGDSTTDPPTPELIRTKPE